MQATLGLFDLRSAQDVLQWQPIHRWPEGVDELDKQLRASRVDSSSVLMPTAFKSTRQ